ncbi:MAG TPA: hypothetical protein VHP35_18700 [Terriglobia bacterium]|nr:hypothetical protein [Terriglobia bacterium]
MKKPRKPEVPRQEPPDQREPYELPPLPSEPDPSRPPAPEEDPPPEEPERKAALSWMRIGPQPRSSIEQPARKVVMRMALEPDMTLRNQAQTASKVVRNLLDTCRESEVGLLRAASRSQKTGLKAFLGTEALQQALFAAELELELKKLQAPAKPPAEPPDKLRGWKEIRGTRLLPSGDDSLLLLCERGERAALGEYVAALQSPLPAGVLGLIERQYAQLKEAYKRLHQIREKVRDDDGMGRARPTQNGLAGSDENCKV